VAVDLNMFYVPPSSNFHHGIKLGIKIKRLKAKMVSYWNSDGVFFLLSLANLYLEAMSLLVLLILT
jgi:hypothetical protein